MNLCSQTKHTFENWINLFWDPNWKEVLYCRQSSDLESQFRKAIETVLMKPDRPTLLLLPSKHTRIFWCMRIGEGTCPFPLLLTTRFKKPSWIHFLRVLEGFRQRLSNKFHIGSVPSLLLKKPLYYRTDHIIWPCRNNCEMCSASGMWKFNSFLIHLLLASVYESCADKSNSLEHRQLDLIWYRRIRRNIAQAHWSMQILSRFFYCITTG